MIPVSQLVTPQTAVLPKAGKARNEHIALSEITLCIIFAASLLEQVSSAASLGTQKGNLHLGAALVGNNLQASPAFKLWVIANRFQVLLTKYSMSQISQG